MLARLALFAAALAVAVEIGHQQAAPPACPTNVPGATSTCYFAGEAVESIYPYRPLVADHTVTVASTATATSLTFASASIP